MQVLESAHFQSLEDRAFPWCSDTPSVGVAVTVDGSTKEVVSDAHCVAFKSGLEANFIKAAAEIDSIVGPPAWTNVR